MFDLLLVACLFRLLLFGCCMFHAVVAAVSVVACFVLHVVCLFVCLLIVLCV